MNKKSNGLKKSRRGHVRTLSRDRSRNSSSSMHKNPDSFEDNVNHVEGQMVVVGPNYLYMAKLFSEFVEGRVKFRWRSETSGNWMIWNGKLWCVDTGGEIFQLVDDFVSDLLDRMKNSDQQSLYIKIANSMTSPIRQKRMLEKARNHTSLTSRPEDYDQEPTFFNCNNGVIDLTTGDLLYHDPKYMMTMITHVDYDSEAKSKLWRKCLRRWTNYDEELIEFLQRSIGYSMTGSFREKHFWFLYGITNTAKTTFLQVFHKMFGYYGDTADIRMFLEKPKFTGVGPKPEIVELQKLRFVIAEEAGQHSKYDVEFLKAITGGSTVRVRPLHSNDFRTFLPYVRIWIGSNWAPGAEYIDQALWNRLLAVPFTNVIPKSEQDNKLVEKLTMNSKHNKAILAWMVQGCFDWQDYGLEIPEIVTEQTRMLREQNDDLLEFKEEIIKVTGDEEDYILCKRIYDIYKIWYGLQGLILRYRKGSKGLYEQLSSLPDVSKSKSVEYHDGKRGLFFYGLKLKPTAVTLLNEALEDGGTSE